jgi:hypothetical protein
MQQSDPNVSPTSLAPAVKVGCSRCGSTGIHACPGHPIVWTEADKARLVAALKAYPTEKSKSSKGKRIPRAKN